MTAPTLQTMLTVQQGVACMCVFSHTSSEEYGLRKLSLYIKSQGFKVLVFIQKKHTQEVKLLDFFPPTPLLKSLMSTQKNKVCRK